MSGESDTLFHILIFFFPFWNAKTLSFLTLHLRHAHSKILLEYTQIWKSHLKGCMQLTSKFSSHFCNEALLQVISILKKGKKASHETILTLNAELFLGDPGVQGYQASPSTIHHWNRQLHGACISTQWNGHRRIKGTFPFAYHYVPSCHLRLGTSYS